MADQLEPFTEQQQIGVVGHIATGGAKVNDCLGGRAVVAVGVYVGHHVVAKLALVTSGCVEVDRVDVFTQLSKLGIVDIQAKLGFGFGQHHPQPAPGRVLPLGAPQ